MNSGSISSFECIKGTGDCGREEVVVEGDMIVCDMSWSLDCCLFA